MILGCGFAGALAGIMARRLGRRVVIVDRTAHPRFAIGESSTPAADLILRRICDRYDIPRLRPLTAWGTWQRSCPHVRGGIKRGFSYFKHEPGAAFTGDAGHSSDLLAAASPDDEHSDTQWYRADVDAFFAREAARSGALILENTVIDHIKRTEGWRLEGFRADERVSIRADFVIDAAGAAGVLARQLHLPTRDMRTRSRAVFGHFKGVPRWREVAASRGARTDEYPFDPDFSALHHVLDGGWMWMLRFNDETLSAGFVLDEPRHPLDGSLSPEAEFFEHARAYPSLRDLFEGAVVADPPGRIIRTGRLQRWTTRAAGSDWALLPHAAGFVDPLHSTGIAHTLSGVERLMALLERGWRGGSNPAATGTAVPGLVGAAAPDSAAPSDSASQASAPSEADSVFGLTTALEEYSRSVVRELELIDLMVSCCYRATADFRLWAASTMLYFAAATSYERIRVEDGDAAIHRSFLLADEPELHEAVQQAAGFLEKHPYGMTDADVRHYERLVESAIRPFNHVALFHPDIPNMYAHTAVRK